MKGRTIGYIGIGVAAAAAGGYIAYSIKKRKREKVTVS
jgi:hypothetical protein